MMLTRRALLKSIPATVLMSSNLQALAQSYPSRPITLVVPYAAGGPADVIGRIVADAMRQTLGQPIVIQNVTGAGGSIGTGRVAEAAPDGYTIVIGNWSTHVANGVLYALPYDLMTDFEPISLLATELDLIVTKKSMPAANLQELIAWLKGNSDRALAATGGVGSPSHVAELLFAKQTETQFRLVPFRGAGPAIQELVAERLDLMITGPSVVLPQLSAGAIKAYAVAAEHRLALKPEIPTTDEAGLPGFHVAVWQALWAPKATPKNIVEKLNMAVRTALSDSIVKQRLADLALEIPSPEQQTPERLRALQAAEIAKWWPVIRAAEIKGE
jgi:tripartite-type tricarboxylate transporter receptor subunit TctC